MMLFQMSLDSVLGPPPALYAALIGGPIPDCLISVNGTSPIAGNEDRLRRASPMLASLLSAGDFKETRLLQLHLTSANAELAFRKVMAYINTGDFELVGCTPEQMISVANECQILSLQDRFRESLPAPQPKPALHMSSPMAIPPHLPSPVSIFSPVPNPFLLMNLQSQLQAANFLQMFMSQLHPVNPSQESLDEKTCKKRRAQTDVREMKKAHSFDNEEPFDNLGDVIIPSTDKEGWCRNKKYIEKTDAGFMCMVCKKIYGRYNSVSYHVTIYHRNPPIKCDLPGCQFTTREARYIHFHKYYRHGIALPQSIDQDRKTYHICYENSQLWVSGKPKTFPRTFMNPCTGKIACI
ncbi:hypothetical protein Y032_0047g1430 [Ancylostoma ceylanicum]|uniref:C2H2-type domain-containing protein n=2 Tax=Ancylostoma ceylanicum TaxID=53326 RepID=A0A016UBY0_9BILA|nr:hypothetical protein Y032_0047g1430 [Ancylostoma ceylanicum]